MNSEESDAALNPDAQRSAVRSEPAVAPGLVLPATGYIWALDHFAGKPQLVQLKYVLMDYDHHRASNFAMTQLAPFVYKPKVTGEIPGTAAAVRLHETTPAIFIRSRYMEAEENAADPAAARKLGELALIKLKVQGQHRVVTTIAYTQVTGNAKRSEEVIEIQTERIGTSDWEKIVPRQALAPGEYALVRLSRRQDLFDNLIFDFAVDPNAPQNSDVVAGNPASAGKKE